MKYVQYRCPACGTYQKRKEDKKRLKTFCMKAKKTVFLIRTSPPTIKTDKL